MNRTQIRQTVLFSMDNHFKRRLASQNNLLRTHNSIQFNTSTPLTTPTNNSLQSTTRSITGSGNFTFTQQRCIGRNPTYNTRFLQKHVRNSQVKRWSTTRIQLEETQKLYLRLTFQNGNITGSYQTNQTRRLSNLYRPVRCLPSYPSACRLPTISPVKLERKNIPILRNPIWPVIGSLAIHQSHQTNFRMGTGTADLFECLPRRLDHHLRDGDSSSTTNTVSNQETGIVRMDHELSKIDSETTTINLAPRLLIGYYKNDSTITRKETQRSTSSIQQILKNPIQSPRTIHSLTMRIQPATFALIPARVYTQHLLRIKNQTVRSSDDWEKLPTLTAEWIQELTWWQNYITHWNGKSVSPQTPQKTVYVDASNSDWDAAYNCATTHWTHQKAQISINWRELKATFLALKTFPNLYIMPIFIRTNNLCGVHEQARLNTIPFSDEISNTAPGMVSSTRNNNPIQSYRRYQ